MYHGVVTVNGSPVVCDHTEASLVMQKGLKERPVHNFFSFLLLV